MPETTTPLTTRLTRQERREATRTKLVEAAAQVFAERGYQAASLDALAERAGFSKGAVYSNFDSKEELFLAVLEARASAFGEDDRTSLMLAMELWLHAMRNPDTRYKLAARYRVLRDTMPGGTEQAAVELAIVQGLAVQRLLDPTALPDDLLARTLDRVRG